MDSLNSHSDFGGRGGGEAELDKKAVVRPLSSLAESWLSGPAVEEDLSSAVPPALTDAATKPKEKLPTAAECTSEDDIRLPDPPNEVVTPSGNNVEVLAVQAAIAAVGDRDNTEDKLRSQQAAMPSTESAEEQQTPQLDLVHQAAILSSVFDDDNDTAVADAAVADAAVPSQLVFPSTSNTQPVTEPFDIQLLAPPPDQSQQHDIVLSEHTAAVSEGVGGVSSQLFLTPSGTLVLSVDSNIVLLDHEQDCARQQLQGEEAESTEALSMPVVSTENNGKTILWSSTAAPGDWPPKAGRHCALSWFFTLFVILRFFLIFSFFA